MKRIICAALCALLMTACAAAEDVKTFTFGGSERDGLCFMAVSGDDRIAMTGWTESSDGTLSSRTKTGLSGWLQVIDGEGNEVFSFCTRLGVHDDLEFPVFHEDGTLTVMLFAENQQWVKLELIRLDMEGNVLSRKVLREKATTDKRFISVAGYNARGYILMESVIVNTDVRTEYFLYDFDGQSLGKIEEWGNGLNASAESHVIHRSEPDGEAYWLYRCEADGSETALCEVFASGEGDLRPRGYLGFISLPDGGATGAGWVLEKDETGEARPGLFTRWDAQGCVVSEMITPGVQFGALAALPDGGFAAMAYPGDRNRDRRCALYFMDEHGVITRTIPLGEMRNSGTLCPIGVLSDGTVVTVKIAEGQNDDAVVTIVAPAAQ